MRQEPLRQKISFFAFILLSGIALSPLSSTGGEPSLSGHWHRPAPAGKGDFSLYPQSCGSCHTTQYEGWKESLHAKAVGPGLLGQLDVGEYPETALSCYTCHAPLLEQQEVQEKENEKYHPNRRFDAALQKSGVSCAACHIRNGKVVGPPPSGGLKTAKADIGKHGKSESRDFFQKSEFCAACHQLDEGYSLNGKLLTNTYREWKQSAWAQQGVRCQSCHMPDRAHLFKGIHDKEMTLRAVDISISREGGPAKLTISNIGAGHYFPTYVTPLIAIKAFSVDTSGKTIAGSQREDFIGRKVSIDLEKEEFDTRIPPNGTHQFVYVGATAGTATVLFEVWVYPDQFYYNLFKSLLEGNSASDPELIKQAMGNAKSTPYLLWKGEAAVKSRTKQ